MPTKEEIIKEFGALADLLIFIEKADGLEIKPRKFLGSDNFAKVAAVTRSLGGEYKSAGKDSHFRIPFSQNQPQQNQASTFTPSDKEAVLNHIEDIASKFNAEMIALRKEIEAMLRK